MIFCEFAESDDAMRPVCVRCGVPKLRGKPTTPLAKMHRECVIGRVQGRDIPALVAIRTIGEKPKTKGVGDVMTEIIAKRYGKVECPHCKAMALLMNKRGPDWCQANIFKLAKQARENARRGGKMWQRFAAAVVPDLMEVTAREIISEAIAEVRAIDQSHRIAR